LWKEYLRQDEGLFEKLRRQNRKRRGEGGWRGPYLGRAGLPRPRTTGPWPGGDRPAVSSKFTPSGPRQALLLPFLRCTGWLHPAVRRRVRPYFASGGRWNLARMSGLPYPLVRAFVLYCRSLWVCSRSAEHVVLAATQTAANKKMRAAAAQSEASFMPAHSSQNHVHCNIFINSWPLRCGPRGRNSD